MVETSGPDRIIRRRDLRAVTGLSVGHCYELIKDNSFPRPIQLGPRAVGWLASEVAAWQAERVKHRDAAIASEPE